MKTLLLTLATAASAMIFSSCGSAPQQITTSDVIYSGSKGGLDTYSSKSSKSVTPIVAPTPSYSDDWKPRLP